ncbi:uncharacterized protein MELLADRAFT_87777 [Melampsora larici-populina 98AG31]|uniref:Zn(2)-C6 fungal-type domain-containing protein n=1 Tax=Melampsora larici-populina (strain 98AG31 / pathotype 3-4-7) TaxID=747676 RepID=F4RPF4_MELLP|nr:uncharacterized protein MELLADRAFT_87777 [Melampsora larici-populina 98AG31]EGG05727.1 hypothetical protein MELLADRAFT_87777 [Melampsora larici-populina 98AG31]
MPADRTHSNQILQNYLSPQSTSIRQESIESYHHQTRLPPAQFDHHPIISSSNLKSKPKRLVSRPLQRNQACSTCRSRKVRCDAARPACGACCRSAAAHGEDPSIVLCQYETENQASQEGISDQDPLFQKTEVDQLKSQTNHHQQQQLTIKINTLEEQIAEVERQISEFDITPTRPNPNPSSNPNPNPNPNPISCNTLPSTLFPEIPLNQITPDQTTITYETTTTSNTTLLSTDWPKSLPPRPIVSKLIEIYLTKQNRNRNGNGQMMFLDGISLQASLHLPPLDSNFPFVGLLHSIMAITLLEEPKENGIDWKEIGFEGYRYWNLHQTGSEYHAEFAKIKIDEAIELNCFLFQAVQSMIIYSVYNYKIASLVEAWVYCGLAVRFATILGLNHLEDCLAYRTGEKSRPRVLLPPPRSLTEKHQRAHSIEESDISTFLPSNQLTSSTTLTFNEFQTHSLSISNPNLFNVLIHSGLEIDEVQIEIKGFVLLGRITDWLRHSPDPIGFNLKKKSKLPLGDIPDLRFQKSFIKLEEEIQDFQTSINRFLPNMKNLQSKVLIQLMICLSKILLHECFMINGIPEEDRSFEICWNSSNSIVQIGDWLMSLNGFDFNSLHP